MSITGIVLAGGAGRRMGGPKALLPWGGMTLVEHAVALLTPVCASVLVVARPEVPLPPLPVGVLMDEPGPDAPLTGVATGLRAATTPLGLVLACDLPNAGDLVARIAATARDDGRAYMASSADRDQPLCAAYPREAALLAADALLLTGVAAMMRLRDSLPVVRVPAAAPELLNLNTPSDRPPSGPSAAH